MHLQLGLTPSGTKRKLRLGFDRSALRKILLCIGLSSFLVLNPLTRVRAQAQSDAAADIKDTRNAAQQLEALSEQLDMQALRDFFEYDPRGRRDPFTIPEVDKPADQLPSHGPLLPLQKFDLSALKLIGIIWDVNRPRAMIQEADSKRIHTVGVNAKIGIRNGYIAVIREGEVVVVETIEQDGRLISTAQIMKLVR